MKKDAYVNNQLRSIMVNKSVTIDVNDDLIIRRARYSSTRKETKPLPRNYLLSSEPFNSTGTLIGSKSSCLILVKRVKGKKRVITQVCAKLFS